MKKKVLFLVVSTFFVLQMHGQVTIGSQTPPNKGALLDLNEGAVTKKGLLLPRVSLSDKSLLELSGVEIPEFIDGADQYLAHVGLLVYNVYIYDKGADDVDPNEFKLEEKICPGVHVWVGWQWQPLVPYSNSLYCPGREHLGELEPGELEPGED